MLMAIRKNRASLLITHPKVAAEWNYEKNGKLTPDQVSDGNGRKVWWRCEKDPTHEWEAIVSNRAKGNGCPLCAGFIATATNSLAAMYPNLLKEWHYEKNGSIRPKDVRPGSSRK